MIDSFKERSKFTIFESNFQSILFKDLLFGLNSCNPYCELSITLFSQSIVFRSNSFLY